MHAEFFHFLCETLWVQSVVGAVGDCDDHDAMFPMEWHSIDALESFLKES